MFLDNNILNDNIGIGWIETEVKEELELLTGRRQLSLLHEEACLATGRELHLLGKEEVIVIGSIGQLHQCLELCRRFDDGQEVVLGIIGNAQRSLNGELCLPTVVGGLGEGE